MIDLRSDTVTKPTPAMRRAMFEAEVGDDVYGEDPTANKLEARAAEVVGKEAALFVPSGTMGNTIAIKLLTEHGHEVICDSRAHLLDWELSMLAWFSGCLVRKPQKRRIAVGASDTELLNFKTAARFDHLVEDLLHDVRIDQVAFGLDDFLKWHETNRIPCSAGGRPLAKPHGRPCPG